MVPFQLQLEHPARQHACHAQLVHLATLLVPHRAVLVVWELLRPMLAQHRANHANPVTTPVQQQRNRVYHAQVDTIPVKLLHPLARHVLSAIFQLQLPPQNAKFVLLDPIAILLHLHRVSPVHLELLPQITVLALVHFAMWAILLNFLAPQHALHVVWVTTPLQQLRRAVFPVLLAHLVAATHHQVARHVTLVIIPK